MSGLLSETKKNSPKIFGVVKDNTILNEIIILALSMYWIMCMYPTDAYVSVYILCAIVGNICAFNNIKNKRIVPKYEKRIAILFSILFAVAVVAANYKCFIPFASSVIKIWLCLAAGYLLAYHVLIWTWRKTNDATLLNPSSKKRNRRTAIFVISFVAISLFDIIYLFTTNYPGSLTPDSINQLNQILRNSYTNHHPYYHTLIIKLFYSIGMWAFQDINAAVALYSCAQIVLMAVSFSYVLMTMYEAQTPMWIIVCSLCVYTFLPYNYIYSVTMWKDILFAGAVVVFCAALFRILNNIGSMKENYAALIIGGVGFGLLRSNGWLALMGTAIILLIFKEKKLKWTVLGVVVFTFICKYPVLSLLGIPQPDTVEHFSIPEQQIARVIVDGGNMTDDEMNLISKVVAFDEVKTKYKPYIADPIKKLIRKSETDYIETQKLEFLKLWISLGIKNPKLYFKAYIDQTKGYWNGGYQYWIWKESIQSNDLGIERKSSPNIIANLFKKWSKAFYNNAFWQPFKSIGLHTWITAIAFAVCLMSKKRNMIIILPLLLIILSLMVATPVYSEFRYAYSLFVAIPLVVAAVLYPDTEKINLLH